MYNLLKDEIVVRSKASCPLQMQALQLEDLAPCQPLK